MGKPDFPRFSFFDFVLEEVSQAGAPWAAALRGLPLAFAGAASFFTDNLWLSEDAPVSSPPLFSEMKCLLVLFVQVILLPRAASSLGGCWGVPEP
jgi:hypothetical protein